MSNSSLRRFFDIAPAILKLEDLTSITVSEPFEKKKKYWYKRIWPNGESGGYFEHTKEDVYKIRIAQELDKSKGFEPMFSLRKAAFWYPTYRYFENHKTALWSLFLVIIGVILAYFIGTRK